MLQTHPGYNKPTEMCANNQLIVYVFGDTLQINLSQLENDQIGCIFINDRLKHKVIDKFTIYFGKDAKLDYDSQGNVPIQIEEALDVFVLATSIINFFKKNVFIFYAWMQIKFLIQYHHIQQKHAIFLKRKKFSKTMDYPFQKQIHQKNKFSMEF